MTTLARIEGYGSLMDQAEVLAGSNLVPKAFRNRPADVVVAMLLGQELGLGPMATMSMVDVIEGNATLNAEGKVSLVRKAGHSITGEAQATRAIAHGRRSDTGDEMTVEWTIQMAGRAGLANKAVWKQYPEAMLWSRAVSQLCRMLFPDVLAGLSYTAEEVEAFSGIESTSPDRPALPAGVDPNTGEILAALSEALPPSTLRPPPGSNVACREDGCDFHGSTDDVREHMVTAHAWTRTDDGRVVRSSAGSTAAAPSGTTDDDGHGPSTGAPPTTAAGEPPDSPPPDSPLLSSGKRTQLIMRCTEAGLAKPDRLAWASETLGRTVESFNELSPDDGRRLLAALADAPSAPTLLEAGA